MIPNCIGMCSVRMTNSCSRKISTHSKSGQKPGYLGSMRVNASACTWATPMMAQTTTLGMSKSPTIQKRRTLESTLLKTVKVPSSVLQLQARQWANWGSLSGLSPTLTRNASPPSTRPTFVPTWNIVSRRGVQALGRMWWHWRKYSVGRLRSSQVWGPRRNINHGSMVNHGQPWLNHGWKWLTKL